MPIDVNWVDIGIALVILSGVLMGTREGLVRQALFLGAIYVSTVLAAQYYAPVGNFLASFFQYSDPSARSLVAFIVLFFAALAWMSWLGYSAYGMTRIGSAATIDTLGGGLLGVAGALLLACVILLATTYGLRLDWLGVDPTVSFARDQMGQSSLASIILSHLSLLVSILRPWLPAGLPGLFTL